jgi:pimeloyl-ACP methyl ester carboxylesterase
MRLRRLPLFVFLTCLTLAACVPAATVPIKTVSFQRSPKSERRSLVVLLPGRGDTVLSYREQGLVEMLTRRGGAVDVLGVEAHVGYYRERNLPQRLREDVILPAKAEGYRDIWMVGISMGGLGALLYDTAYPGDLAGLFLLAPYLGDGTLLKEIAGSGGLTGWRDEAQGSLTLDREIWRTLREYVTGTKGAGRVFLGYGADDRFAASDSVFGAVLPARQVATAPGGHDWTTWRTLWPLLLDLSPCRQPQDAGKTVPGCGKVSEKRPEAKEDIDQIKGQGDKPQPVVQVPRAGAGPGDLPARAVAH